MARQRGGRGGRGGRGARGGRSGEGGRGSQASPKKRGSRRGGRGAGGAQPQKPGAWYYMQPGRRGSIVILHRPVGNRVSPKVCGVMPSRAHATALVDQLRRAESALHDLFYEATDDGIEALEAVLAACREAVLTRIATEPGAAEHRLATRGEHRFQGFDTVVGRRVSRGGAHPHPAPWLCG